MRTIALVVAVLSQCTPSKPPAPLVDAEAMRTYVCPVGDGGVSWTCQDGVGSEAGTCLQFGCVPR